MHKECVTLARLYWIMHEFQENGKGWMVLDEIYAVAKKYIGWDNKQYVRSILERGEGVVWERWEHKHKGNKYNIFKPERVTNHFNSSNIGQRKTIPVKSFRKLALFRSELRRTWLEEKQSIHIHEHQQDGGVRDEILTTAGKTISRVAQKELFGISRITQIKQEKLLGMNVQPCFAYHEWNESYREFLPIRDDGDGGGPYKQRGQWIEETPNGQSVLMWQIPNRYQDRSNTETFGRLGDSYWVRAGGDRKYYEVYELAKRAIRMKTLHENGIYVFEKEFDYFGRIARLYKFIPNSRRVPCQVN